MKAKGKKRAKRTIADCRPPNSITGEPRRWICHNLSSYDSVLQALEVIWFAGTKRGRQKAISLQTWQRIIETLECSVQWARRSCAERYPVQLTRAELRYCDLEGINPADFLKAKQPAS